MNVISQRLNRLTLDAGLIAGCLALVLGVVWAYWPGLSGPFVFDDFAALEPLGINGGVIDWGTLKEFVMSGGAGPTGRPLAMMTFLLDANTWPTDSWPLKRSNLVIHLINGALLGVLIKRILEALDFKRQDARWIALCSTGVWLLHPFLVSTTLYVVQRMAELSALFMFGGLLAYVSNRKLVTTRPHFAYAILSISIVAFTIAGVLAKENAVLLPILIGVVEWTVFASRPKTFGVLNRVFAIVFLVTPCLLICGYLLQLTFTDSLYEIVAPRDFSLYERLITQPRVIFDYLQHWFLPSLYTTGVFQDHFIVSTGIVSPLSTLVSLIFHISVVAFAILYRVKWPLVSLAILFFYGGHLLESTSVNLELYFEHRNYLPASLLFVPIIASFRQRVPLRIFVTTMIGVLIVLGGFTRYSASVWQDFPSMVEASARKAPTSARAQADYAKNLFNSGRYEEALGILDQAIDRIPRDKPHLLISRLTMLCRLDMLGEQELMQASERISNTVYDPRLINIYYELIASVSTQQCPNVSLNALREVFVGMLRLNENADEESERFAQIQYFIGMIDAYNDDPVRAMVAFKLALQSQSSAQAALNMAKLLASRGYFDQALELSNIALAKARQGQQDTPPLHRITEGDIVEFERFVGDEQRSRAETGTGGPSR